MRIFEVILAGTALCSLALAAPASAQDGEADSKIDVDTRLTLQYYTQDNMDLGTTNEDQEHSLSEQLQLLLGADFAEDFYGFFHGRALNIDGGGSFEDEDSGTVSTDEDSFLELRELYVEKTDLFGVVPLSLQVGRQRIREPRSIWWNSDFDAVRLKYDTTLLTGFIAAGEDQSSYRTTDGDYMEDDENRFRTLGELSWQYRYGHFVEGRFLYEDDHSDIEPAGTVVDASDRDNEDQNVVWTGVRAAGSFDNAGVASFVKYRADVIGVAGEEDELLTAAGPGANQRTVTGSRQRDVRGWAFDASLIADPADRGGAVVFGGYAFGSGDGDPADGTDEEFRQTDMQGSSSRTGLERQQQKNYGEVLKPELANLHVAHAGAAYPITDATDVSLTYFNYHLDDNATRLRSSGIAAPLNGTDDFVGEALDLMLNIDLDDQFGFRIPYTRDFDFRLVAGSFFPGGAYAPNDNNEAFRIFSEIKLRF